MKILNAIYYAVIAILTFGVTLIFFIKLDQYNRDLAIYLACGGLLIYFTGKAIYWYISAFIYKYFELKRSWVVYIAEFDKSNPLKVKHGYRRVVQAYDSDTAISKYIETYTKDIPAYVFNSNIKIIATRQIAER